MVLPAMASVPLIGTSVDKAALSLIARIAVVLPAPMGPVKTTLRSRVGPEGAAPEGITIV